MTRWRRLTAATTTKSPYRHYFGNMRAKMMRGNRLYVFKSRQGAAGQEITLDYVMRQLRVLRHGQQGQSTPILAMREETGDFGELVYAGMDWADQAARQASMQLMAEEVMPRVNAAIGKPAQDRGGVMSWPGCAADPLQ